MEMWLLSVATCFNLCLGRNSFCLSIASQVQYTVQVLHNGTHICSGALYSAKVVLTDATCVGPPASEYTVGILQPRHNFHIKTQIEEVHVTKIITDTTPCESKTSIAALILNQTRSTSVKLLPDIVGIGEYSGLNFLLAGWRQQKQNINPKVIKINSYNHICSPFIEGKFRLPICLYQGNSMEHICHLQKGSPLIYYSEEQAFLVGIKGTCYRATEGKLSNVKYSEFISIYNHKEWLKSLRNSYK